MQEGSHSQSGVPGPALITSRNLLEMQILGPHSRPLEPDILGVGLESGLVHRLKYKDHRSEAKPFTEAKKSTATYHLVACVSCH